MVGGLAPTPSCLKHHPPYLVDDWQLMWEMAPLGDPALTAADTESQARRMRDSFWRQFPRSRSHMSLAQLAQSQPAAAPGHGQTAADAASRAARRR